MESRPNRLSIGEPLTRLLCGHPLIAAALVLVSSSATSRADGTYVKWGAGGVVPMNNEDVQLVRETIDVAVDRKDLLADDSRLVVTVTYRFRNHRDHVLKVLMGFPVGLDLRTNYQQGRDCTLVTRRDCISQFSVSVDGQPTAARLIPVARRYRPPRRCVMNPPAIDPAAAFLGKGLLFDRYHVWPVTFAPRQERTVVNRYLHDARAGLYSEHHNEFRYVLRTGAAWRGLIEEATIRLRLNDKGCLSENVDEGCFAIHDTLAPLDSAEREDDRLWRQDPVRLVTQVPQEVSPRHPTRQVLPDGSVVFVWTLRRFEPAADVHFTYETAGAHRRRVRDAIRRSLARESDVATRRNALDTLLALHGVRSLDHAVQKRMDAKSWFLAVPAMRRSMLHDPLLDAVERSLRGGTAQGHRPRHVPSRSGSGGTRGTRGRIAH